MKKIENIHADCLSEHSCAIGWDCDGARFHFWIDLPSRQSQGTLYKNPPLGLKTTDAGYFHTRQLDPDAKTNAAMVGEAIATVLRDRLIEGLIASEDEKKRKAAIEQAEAARVYIIQEAGVDLYEALKIVRRAIRYGGVFEQHTIQAINAAITKAEGGAA